MKEDFPNEGKSQKYMSTSKSEPKEETGGESSKPKFRFKKKCRIFAIGIVMEVSNGH